MDNKWIKLLLWILLISFYICINILLGSLIKSFNIKNDLLLNFVYIISEIVIASILIYLYRKDFKGKYKELKDKDGNKKIDSSIKIWLIGAASMFILNIFLSLIISDIADNEAVNRTIISNYSLYAITSMILITPICEEIIFRLALNKVTDKKYLYIILSGLIFGYAHIIGATGMQTLYVLPYTAIGISFATIYQKEKNILCSILMHSIHNLVCIAILFIF